MFDDGWMLFILVAVGVLIGVSGTAIYMRGELDTEIKRIRAERGCPACLQCPDPQVVVVPMPMYMPR